MCEFTNVRMCEFLRSIGLSIRTLNKHFRARSKTFSECFWSAALFLFEYPVEVGDIVETAVIRNLCYGMGGID